MFESTHWSATGFVVLATFVVVGLVLLASARPVEGIACLGLAVIYVPIRARRSRWRS
jgi:hypothetical protein